MTTAKLQNRIDGQTRLLLALLAALGALVGSDLVLREGVGEAAAAAVLAVVVVGHENTGTADLLRALATLALDLASLVNLVELEHGKLDVLVLVLDLLGLGVDLGEGDDGARWTSAHRA